MSLLNVSKSEALYCTNPLIKALSRSQSVGEAPSLEKVAITSQTRTFLLFSIEKGFLSLSCRTTFRFREIRGTWLKGDDLFLGVQQLHNGWHTCF